MTLHHSLVAWQRADDLFIALHQLSLTFPPIERYALASQLRRSAYSVPAHIAEGAGRHTEPDKLKFFHIALASLAEAGYCLHAAKRATEKRSDPSYPLMSRRMRKK